MADNTRPRNVSLWCYDSKAILVDEVVAKQSQFVKQIIEQHPRLNNNVIFIDLPVVTSKILQKVLQYCTKHAAASASTTTTSATTNTTAGEANGGGAAGELRRWDEEFVMSLEPDILLDVLVAAASLDIQSLIDLLCKDLPEVPEDKPAEQIRKMF